MQLLSPHLIPLFGYVDEFKGRWASIATASQDLWIHRALQVSHQSAIAVASMSGHDVSAGAVAAWLERSPHQSFRSEAGFLVTSYARRRHDLAKGVPDSPFDWSRWKAWAHDLIAADGFERSQRMAVAQAPAHWLQTFSDIGSTQIDPATALCRWARAQIGDGAHHPLWIIGTWFVAFRSLEPLPSGNLRTALLMSLETLHRSGYSFVPWLNVEAALQAQAESWERLLKSAAEHGAEMRSKGLELFLRALVSSVHELEDVLFREVELLALPALADQILTLAQQHGRITTRAATTWTGASRNTVKLHLRQLAHQGKLQTRGRGKGTWYTPG